MFKIWMGVMSLGMLLWGGVPHAFGQKATEMFIPIGQSPGLSGQVTVIGKIETSNAAGRSITIAGSAETWRATITDRTRIWLDKSNLQSINQTGTFDDLKKGLLVEVKYEGNGRKGQGPAEWIKCAVN